ncbi:hypothetical protein BASA61_010070 [Batrachochytrium salamandrivorans]|nr:hypothetical protein BASA62_007084 [Batrachochytrium salamandrivorans]KAH6579727.1 hypothetical protein BASA61_010070 [Batrachochytrium salamandrivorans]KAH9265155.1 hypothetical protein BASA83_011311 [Batrachochytrium salamandrivorans]
MIVDTESKSKNNSETRALGSKSSHSTQSSIPRNTKTGGITTIDRSVQDGSALTAHSNANTTERRSHSQIDAATSPSDQSVVAAHPSNSHDDTLERENTPITRARIQVWLSAVATRMVNMMKSLVDLFLAVLPLWTVDLLCTGYTQLMDWTTEMRAAIITMSTRFMTFVHGIYTSLISTMVWIMYIPLLAVTRLAVYSLDITATAAENVSRISHLLKNRIREAVMPESDLSSENRSTSTFVDNTPRSGSGVSGNHQ